MLWFVSLDQRAQFQPIPHSLCSALRAWFFPLPVLIRLWYAFTTLDIHVIATLLAGTPFIRVYGKGFSFWSSMYTCFLFGMVSVFLTTRSLHLRRGTLFSHSLRQCSSCSQTDTLVSGATRFRSLNNWGAVIWDSSGERGLLSASLVHRPPCLADGSLPQNFLIRGLDASLASFS